MIKRRTFLNLAAGATAVHLLTQCAKRGSRQPSHTNLSNTLQQTRVYQSNAGSLAVDLHASSTYVTFGDRLANLLTYNSSFPGPTLEASPGDTVRLTLRNELDTPTNLHYHGLHISPDVDNVFRNIPPGEQYTYEFQIPNNHPAMTGWYHPHYHLNVASQVFRGLAGPLIIRGDVDRIPEIQQADEAILMLQDIEPIPDPALQEPHPLGKRWGREGNLVLAHGSQNPVVNVPQNGLLRLRLINSSASRIYQLQLKDHPWFLMATDRGAIAEPTELQTLLLSPGERAEMLIPGHREPGEYQLINQPYDRGVDDIISSFGDEVHQMTGVVKPTQTTVATLRYVEGDRPAPLPLPKQLIPVEPLPLPTITREFVLNHGLDSTAESTGFTINAQSFVMDRINTRVRLNDVEDWHIVNNATIDHPFHLHTNRFQIIERNGQPEPLSAWKDTVSLKGNETVTIRVRFDDFVGRTVYHCHILDHEDQGMMGILEIQAA
ncbi:MAG: multicopper oxidase family protein [Cyanobacteria bacterium J06633_2]